MSSLKRTFVCIIAYVYIYRVPEICTRLREQCACTYRMMYKLYMAGNISSYTYRSIQSLLCLSLSSRLHGQVNSTQNLVGIHTRTQPISLLTFVISIGRRPARSNAVR